MSNAPQASTEKQRIENWQHLINAYHEAKRPEIYYDNFRLEIDGKWGGRTQGAYEQMVQELDFENPPQTWQEVLKKLKENGPDGTTLVLGKSKGRVPAPAPQAALRKPAADAPAAAEQPTAAAPVAPTQPAPVAAAPTPPAPAASPAAVASAPAAPASTAPVAPAAASAAASAIAANTTAPASQPQASTPTAAASAASAGASQPAAKPAPAIAAASAPAARTPAPATGDEEPDPVAGLKTVLGVGAALGVAAASVAAYRASRSNGAETAAPAVAEAGDEPAHIPARRNGAAKAATTEAVTPEATTAEAAKPAARTPAQPGTQKPVTRTTPPSNTTTPAAATSTKSAGDGTFKPDIVKVGAPSIAAENTEPSLKYPDPLKGYKGTIEMNAIPDGILFTDSGGKYQRPTDRHKNHDAIVAGATEFADPHASQHEMLRAAAEAADKLAPSLTDKNSGSTFTAATWKDGKIWTTHVGDSPAWVMEITAEGKVIPHLINGNFHNPSPFATNQVGLNLGGNEGGWDALNQFAEDQSKLQNFKDLSQQKQAGSRFVMLVGSDGLLDHTGAGLGSIEDAVKKVDAQISDAGTRYATLIEKHVAEGRSLNDPQLAVRINDAATDMHGQSKAKKEPNYLTNPKNKDNTTFALVELGSKEVTVVVADGNYDDGKSIATKVADVARRHLKEPFALKELSTSKTLKDIANQDIAATTARKAAAEAASKGTQQAATAESDATARTPVAPAETGDGTSAKTTLVSDTPAAAAKPVTTATTEPTAEAAPAKAAATPVEPVKAAFDPVAVAKAAAPAAANGSAAATTSSGTAGQHPASPLRHANPSNKYGGDIRAASNNGTTVVTDSGGSGLNRPPHIAVAVGTTTFLESRIAAGQYTVLAGAAEKADAEAQKLGKSNHGGSKAAIAAVTVDGGTIVTTNMGAVPVWAVQVKSDGQVTVELINKNNLNNTVPYESGVVPFALGGDGEGAHALAVAQRRPQQFQSQADYTNHLKTAGNQLAIMVGGRELFDRTGPREQGTLQGAADWVSGRSTPEAEFARELKNARNKVRTVVQQHLAAGGKLDDPQLAVLFRDAEIASHADQMRRSDPNYPSRPNLVEPSSVAVHVVQPNQPQTTLVVASGHGSHGGLVAQAAVEATRSSLSNKMDLSGLEKPHSAAALYDSAGTDKPAAPTDTAAKPSGRGATGGAAAPAETGGSTTARGTAINGAGNTPGGTNAALANHQPLPTTDTPMVGNNPLNPEVAPHHQLALAPVEQAGEGRAAAANDAPTLLTQVGTVEHAGAGRTEAANEASAAPTKPAGTAKQAVSAARGSGIAGGALGAASLGMRFSDSGSYAKAARVGGTQVASEKAAVAGEVTAIAAGAAEAANAIRRAHAPTATPDAKVGSASPSASKNLLSHAAKGASSIVGAGAGYLEYNAASKAQDGERAMNAAYGTVGGLTAGAIAGSHLGWLGAIGMGLAGAVVAAKEGRDTYKGQQKQRELNLTAQKSLDTGIDMLRPLHDKGREKWTPEDQHAANALDTLMRQHIARMEVLDVPATDVVGKLHQQAQLQQAKKVVDYLSGTSQLPETSLQHSARLVGQIDALLPQLDTAATKSMFDHNKDGKLTRADVMATLSRTGIELHLLDTGNGLTAERLVNTLKDCKEAESKRQLPITQRINGGAFSVLANLQTVASAAMSIPAQNHLRDKLAGEVLGLADGLKKAGLGAVVTDDKGQVSLEAVRKNLDAHGIRASQLDLNADGKITLDEATKALPARGITAQKTEDKSAKR